MPCFDPVLTTRPGPPCASIQGTKACTPLIAPHRLTSINRRQPSISSHGLPGLAPMPALFIRRLIAPNWIAAWSCRSCTASKRETSTTALSTLSGEEIATTASRASSSAPSCRSASMTFSPRAASVLAAARPMPLASPVITAVRPGSRAGWVMRLLLSIDRPTRPTHGKQGLGGDLEIVAQPPGAQDRAGGRRLVDAVGQKCGIDVDGHHLAQNQPGVDLGAVRALQLDQLAEAAFEIDRAFQNARRGNQAAGDGGETRHLELIDLRRGRRGGQVHLLAQRLGGQVPAE